MGVVHDAGVMRVVTPVMAPEDARDRPGSVRWGRPTPHESSRRVGTTSSRCVLFAGGRMAPQALQVPTHLDHGSMRTRDFRLAPYAGPGRLRERSVLAGKDQAVAAALRRALLTLGFSDVASGWPLSEGVSTWAVGGSDMVPSAAVPGSSSENGASAFASLM